MARVRAIARRFKPVDDFPADGKRDSTEVSVHLRLLKYLPHFVVRAVELMQEYANDIPNAEERYEHIKQLLFAGAYKGLQGQEQNSDLRGAVMQLYSRELAG